MALIERESLKDITVMESPIFGLLMKFENGRADIDETTNAIINSVEEDIREEIRKAPTVDAEPVRHGKWIDYTDEGYVECDQCHSATNCDGDIEELNYCWHCGARMHKRKKNE